MDKTMFIRDESYAFYNKPAMEGKAKEYNAIKITGAIEELFEAGKEPECWILFKTIDNIEERVTIKINILNKMNLVLKRVELGSVHCLIYKDKKYYRFEAFNSEGNLDFNEILGEVNGYIGKDTVEISNEQLVDVSTDNVEFEKIYANKNGFLIRKLKGRYPYIVVKYQIGKKWFANRSVQEVTCLCCGTDEGKRCQDYFLDSLNESQMKISSSDCQWLFNLMKQCPFSEFSFFDIQRWRRRDNYKIFVNASDEKINLFVDWLEG